MLRRTSFKRAVYVAPARQPLKRVQGARAATMGAKQRSSDPIAKDEPLRSEAYRRLICTLACARCGIVGFTQPCHADESKGMSLKSDDRTCWPGCGPHDGKPGCHHFVGTTGALGKIKRREVELEYAEKAQRDLKVKALTDKRVAAVLRAVGMLE